MSATGAFNGHRLRTGVQRGEVIVLVNDLDRNPHGILFVAAEKATPESVSFIITHGSGFVCVAIAEEECDRLWLPAMPLVGCARADAIGYAVSVDASHGTTTGISGRDRARTIAALADRTSTPDDFTRPGHVLPIRVSSRPGEGGSDYARAAVQLAALAGCRPAGAVCALTDPASEISLAGPEQAVEFAEHHGLLTVSTSDLLASELTSAAAANAACGCASSGSWLPGSVAS